MQQCERMIPMRRSRQFVQRVNRMDAARSAVHQYRKSNGGKAPTSKELAKLIGVEEWTAMRLLRSIKAEALDLHRQAFNLSF